MNIMEDVIVRMGIIDLALRLRLAIKLSIFKKHGTNLLKTWIQLLKCRMNLQIMRLLFRLLMMKTLMRSI